MDWTAIIIQALIMFGAGGVGAALMNGYFNRDKTKAEANVQQSQADAKLSESEAHYQETLTAIAQSLVVTYRDEVRELRARQDRLEKAIDNLKNEIKGRDMRISELETENKELKKELSLVREQNDRLIRENRGFADRIRILEKRLNESDGAKS